VIHPDDMPATVHRCRSCNDTVWRVSTPPPAGHIVDVDPRVLRDGDTDTPPYFEMGREGFLRQRNALSVPPDRGLPRHAAHHCPPPFTCRYCGHPHAPVHEDGPITATDNESRTSA